MKMTKLNIGLFLMISPAMLTGCGGEGCAGQLPPAIWVDVSAYGATGEQLCDAQAVAYDGEGYVEFVEGVIASGPEQQPICRFVFAQQRFGSYTFELQVQGFEPLTLADLGFADDNDSCTSDTASFAETLTASVNVCHDGYEWVDEACHTANGCSFPQLEQQVIPGVQGAEISYACVAACETPASDGYTLPEAPGRCEALALP